MNILIYDEDKIQYIIGDVNNFNIEHNENNIEADLSLRFCKFEDYIKLDETLMKRIAKYNKEVEIKKLDIEIEKKKQKIEELEDILEDREKRVEKLKEFIANIYNIDISEDEEYDWDV